MVTLRNMGQELPFPLEGSTRNEALQACLTGPGGGAQGILGTVDE